MDRHRSTEAGRATVLYESDEESAEEVRLFWHSASVWRMEQRGGGRVSDGTQVQEWRGRQRWPPHPVHREGGPDYWFQLVFPLRAHVWGRSGDDYFPSQTRRHPDGVLVTLNGMEDDREGHLLVDPDSGFIREISFLSGRRTLRLADLQRGPLDAGASPFSIST